MKPHFLAIPAALAAALLSTKVAAQQWLDRDRVIVQLAREYAERPVGAGVAGNGGIVELFVAPGGATWTLVLTMPNGLSRLVAAGEGWATVPGRRKGAPL